MRSGMIVLVAVVVIVGCTDGMAPEVAPRIDVPATVVGVLDGGLTCTIPVRLHGTGVTWTGGSARHSLAGVAVTLTFGAAHLEEIQRTGYTSTRGEAPWTVELAARYERGGRTGTVTAASTCVAP